MVEIEDIPVVYLFIYKRMEEGADINGVISNEDIKKIMRNILYHLPSPLRYGILEDMEKMELIKKINKQFFHILPIDANKLNNKYKNFPLW